jgi:acetylornithine deacetylase/succinyl-diaminopimelate desuccinylase-like protein
MLSVQPTKFGVRSQPYLSSGRMPRTTVLFASSLTALLPLAACAQQRPVTTTAAPPGLASTYVVAGSAPAGYDRSVGQRETELHLSNLVRLDTQNPPGNELIAAQYFDSLFRDVPGFETHILMAADGRANFVGRLRATRPTGRPVMVVGHTDVVGADTTKWSTPPFEPTIRDGYMYGRGTIDDKGMLAATVTSLLMLAQRRDELTRDIIFVGTAGEEGGPSVGIAWIIEHRPELIRDAEFALNEGGRIRVQDGLVRTVNIQTTEKVPYNVLVTARGPSGHGSVPIPDNSLAALARAVGRVHEWRSPVVMNETTRLYFSRLATIESDAEVRRAMEQLSDAGSSRQVIDAAAAILSREPLHNAVLRAGQSLTIMQGGTRNNVIPSDGTANFNLRVLPSEDVTAIVREMNRVGAEPSVTFELIGEPQQPPPVSPVTTALYQSMERAAVAMVPTTIVIPFMSTGATDGSKIRAFGIPTYGILPLPLPMEDELRMHGDDERAPLPALGWATEYIYRVLQGVM